MTGQIGFLLASKATQNRRSLRKPVRIPEFLDDLRWYSPEQHRASFTLPPFVERELAPLQNQNGDDDEEYRCILQHVPSCILL